MDEVLHANIFFFITSVAVVVCTVLLTIVFFHLIKAARALRRIVESIEAGAEVIAEDMQQIRSFFSQGGNISRLIRMLAGKVRRGGSKRASRRADRKKDELEITDEQ